MKVFEYLTIDAATRRITVPQAEQTFGVQSDTQAVRKYFKCPRYVGDGLDLAGMFLRVNFRNANGEVDAYLVDDVTVDGDVVTFSWLLSKKATAYVGQTSFVVCAVSGRGLPEWNTTLAVGNVLQGLEPDSSTVEAETADVIAQLLAMVTAQTGNVEAVGAAQVKAVQAAAKAATTEAEEQIQAKGAATLATIPEDYSALSGTVDRLTRDRAAAIVCQAEGETIQVQDASNDPLQGLRIFGRSTQDGTPTPDNPVEIVSLASPVVTLCGVNLIQNGLGSRTIAGITFTTNTDGSITANGTSTDLVQAVISDGFLFRAGVRYRLTGCPSGGGKDTYRIDNTDKLADDGSGGFAEYATDTVFPVRIRIAAGVTVSNLTFFPMLRFASIEDDTYEAPAGQTLTITTPGSLPGIPVESGGNYTDADGQQWICDEVDLARGVYVQRVRACHLYDYFNKYCTQADNTKYSEDVLRFDFGYCFSSKTKTTVLCNMFSYGFAHGDQSAFVRAKEGVSSHSTSDVISVFINRARLVSADLEGFEAYLENNAVTVLYALATPIEHALTDAELQAFRALHSCKPTTTVLNDAGAHMVLEYAADPKTYIDNKLAALVAGND